MIAPAMVAVPGAFEAPGTKKYGLFHGHIFVFLRFRAKKNTEDHECDGSNSLKKQVRAIPIAGASSSLIAPATGVVAGAF